MKPRVSPIKPSPRTSLPRAVRQVEPRVVRLKNGVREDRELVRSKRASLQLAAQRRKGCRRGQDDDLVATPRGSPRLQGAEPKRECIAGLLPRRRGGAGHR